MLWRYLKSCYELLLIFLNSGMRYTIDGRNPAPVDRWFIPLFTRFYTSQVGAGFLPSTSRVLWDSLVASVLRSVPTKPHQTSPPEDNPAIPRRRLRPTWRLEIAEEEHPVQVWPNKTAGQPTLPGHVPPIKKAKKETLILGRKGFFLGPNEITKFNKPWFKA